ncbi:acyltransferase family protein [Bacillus pseudomycoides]|uniref:Acyltransferase n=1 Tax=Bacillus pseudomycoides TaxID=64104 RepID=A0A2B6RWA8_9BACI|nr:acyltransferase [Bacillus pseudomycoides]PDY48182.1 acyltransferase [Bacillus pseudomycoides]PEA84116.1 acyltransferase [Bacillus pseudomycoides]PED07768.1 acyltransferase [Bacillus pseudomycoides]PED71004.1 acyltransferase [Bacillus pseudomycoides]PEI44354.1 acyltransferase [Bacillus pseudomycoides]
MTRRYKELDSLRGIAAIIVLLGHFLALFPILGKKVMYSTFGVYFSILWQGHSAVIIFFVLSGFVLSLPFYKGTEFNYLKYLIKRVCRIYIPYIVILFIAIGIKLGIHSKIGTIPGLVQWGSWNIEVSFNRVMDHILFLREFNSDAFIMVIWSLVHEMRISIVFPLIIFLLLRVNWKVSIGIAMFLSVIGYLLMKNIPSEFNMPVSTNYFITLHYSSMFIIGALLAKNREYLVSKIMNLKVKYLLLPLGLLFFSYPRIPFMLLSKLIGEIDYELYLIIIDWYICFGAVLIILSALSSKLFSKLLLIKPVQFIGEISYSLYLVHPIVLLTTVHIFYGKISVPLILVISFLFTMVVSVLCYKFIEIPSIKIGRKLATENSRGDISLRKKAS